MNFSKVSGARYDARHQQTLRHSLAPVRRRCGGAAHFFAGRRRGGPAAGGGGHLPAHRAAVPAAEPLAPEEPLVEFPFEPVEPVAPAEPSAPALPPLPPVPP